MLIKVFGEWINADRITRLIGANVISATRIVFDEREHCIGVIIKEKSPDEVAKEINSKLTAIK